MKSLEPYKYGNPILHSQQCETYLDNDDLFGLRSKKIYKIKVRKKMVYIFELFYYEHFVFAKYYPKIHEDNKSRYSLTNIGLYEYEKRRLLSTCCHILLDEIKKHPHLIYSYVAQVYDRDRIKERKISVRGSIYKKLVSTFFMNEELIHFNNDHFNFYCVAVKERVPEEIFIKRLQFLADRLKDRSELISEFVI